jgi:WD repeat-containing protein 59
MAMKAPAFSLDYFPSKDVAWSLYQESRPRDGTTTPVAPHYRRSMNQWDYFNNRLGTYGSAGSSNGPWAGDAMPSEPLTPYSTGNTPPSHPRPLTQLHSFTGSLSTSPDISHHRPTRRSTSNLSTAFATFSRAFPTTASSSPDDRHRHNPDLSTSAPSGITWGTNTIYTSGSSPSPEKLRRLSLKRRPSTANDSAYDSEEDFDEFCSEDESSTPIRPAPRQQTSPTVRVKLKNQHLFDDEAFASEPLLDLSQGEKYTAYREAYAEQLGVWGLAIARAEVLKFNGLTSYWPSESEPPDQSHLPPPLPARRAKDGKSLITMATAQEKVSTTTLLTSWSRWTEELT